MDGGTDGRSIPTAGAKVGPLQRVWPVMDRKKVKRRKVEGAEDAALHHDPNARARVGVRQVGRGRRWAQHTHRRCQGRPPAASLACLDRKKKAQNTRPRTAIPAPVPRLAPGWMEGGRRWRSIPTAGANVGVRQLILVDAEGYEGVCGGKGPEDALRNIENTHQNSPSYAWRMAV